ncbi:MAG TPA: hypothetical protein VMC85_11280 [Desulfomonilaceae bacterium]|nr:hypothetical protein [Desulfomonilaceae bacterium]
MKGEYLFAPESVSEGHPDEAADRVSDGSLVLPSVRILMQTLRAKRLLQRICS